MLAKKAKEVLITLQKAGFLKDLLLIGSWCGSFYSAYFEKEKFNPTIQTLDIDFLIPEPKRISSKDTSLTSLLEPLDFDMEFTGSGWTRFVHPELRVEFLVPRLGPQSDDPKLIKEWSIKAMPLRHTHVLTKYMIQLDLSGVKVKLPHPAAFALHKLFVSGRRKEKGKAIRDLELASRLLEVLKKQGEFKILKKVWESFTKNERIEILKIIDSHEHLLWLKEILKN